MKILSLFLLMVAVSGCGPAPHAAIYGSYESENQTIIETLDFAEGGAAMHSIELKSKDNPQVSQLFEELKLSQVRWSNDGDKIQVVGLFNGTKEKQREVVWVFNLQPNGDLVRHSDNGDFDRFIKRQAP